MYCNKCAISLHPTIPFQLVEPVGSLVQTVRVDLLPAGSLFDGVPERSETRLAFRGRDIRDRQARPPPGLSYREVLRQTEGIPNVLLDLVHDSVPVIRSLSAGEHSNAGKPGREMEIRNR